MKTVFLKTDDMFFLETEIILSKIKNLRNRYINEALEFYNKMQRQKMLEKKLIKESALAKNESLSVLHEIEEIDYADYLQCYTETGWRYVKDGINKDFTISKPNDFRLIRRFSLRRNGQQEYRRVKILTSKQNQPSTRKRLKSKIQILR